MAVDCEIDQACGITALGRCVRCQRAFCAGHQINMKPSDLHFFGLPEYLCHECHLPFSEERAAEQKHMDRERRIAQGRLEVATADVQDDAKALSLDLLRALGWRPGPYVDDLTEPARGLFSRRRSVPARVTYTDSQPERDRDRGMVQGPRPHYLTSAGEPVMKNLSPDFAVDWLSTASALYRQAVEDQLRLPVPAAVLDHPSWPEGFRRNGKWAPPEL